MSYLPLLLPRLHAFFATSLIADAEIVAQETGYFTYDNIPLRWQLPLGLLYDMHILSVNDASTEQTSAHVHPFRLILHFAPDSTSDNANLINPSSIVMHDSFINSVKEADFLRSGTAKPIMTLPAAESKALWDATQHNDRATFSKVHQTLIPTPGQFRNIPLRLYLPSSTEGDPTTAQMRVLQSPVAPSVQQAAPSSAAQARLTPTAQAQTLGTALHTLLPGLFPSRRTPILAKPILHGAQVPLSANLEEMAQWACYADGWLSMIVAISG